jgi:hypothetical protein
VAYVADSSQARNVATAGRRMNTEFFCGYTLLTTLIDTRQIQRTSVKNVNKRKGDAPLQSQINYQINTNRI